MLQVTSGFMRMFRIISLSWKIGTIEDSGWTTNRLDPNTLAEQRIHTVCCF